MRTKYYITLFLLLALFLASCRMGEVEKTPVPTIEKTPVPTQVGEGEVGGESEILHDLPTVTQVEEACGPNLAPVLTLAEAKQINTNYTVNGRAVLIGHPDQIKEQAQTIADKLGVEIVDFMELSPLPTVLPQDGAVKLSRLFIEQSTVLETLDMVNRTIEELELDVTATPDPQADDATLNGLVFLAGNETDVDKLYQAISDSDRAVTLIQPFKEQDAAIYQVDLGDASKTADFIRIFNEQTLETVTTGRSQIVSATPLAEPTYVGGDTGGSYIGVEGSGASLGLTDSELFFNQTMLSDIHLPQNPPNADNVKVLLFDSSPLPTGEYSIQLGKAYEPFTLCNHALISGNEYQLPSEGHSHGFFAANLVHVVAPDAQLHLIQVMQFDEELGLYTELPHLISVLEHYLTQLAPGEKAVVNLSLGLRVEETPFLLQQAILAYESQGVVIAAAAGNQKELFTQTPASDPHVIGVASSIMKPNAAASELSCYSNPGNVAAPGGDDIDGDCEGEELGIVASCLPFVEMLPDEEPCPYGIISLGMHAPDEPMFAYWLGTSFATPLVSGAAALALADGAVSPEQVRNMIFNNADNSAGVGGFGAGILDVSKMLGLP
ncbi:MAG: S8/S53 family peptidase [Candidatus Promineifilaceae bacterium]